jgi:hypothetical protein
VRDGVFYGDSAPTAGPPDPEHAVDHGKVEGRRIGPRTPKRQAGQSEHTGQSEARNRPYDRDAELVRWLVGLTLNDETPPNMNSVTLFTSRPRRLAITQCENSCKRSDPNRRRLVTKPAVQPAARLHVGCSSRKRPSERDQVSKAKIKNHVG